MSGLTVNALAAILIEAGLAGHGDTEVGIGDGDMAFEAANARLMQPAELNAAYFSNFDEPLFVINAPEAVK